MTEKEPNSDIIYMPERIKANDTVLEKDRKLLQEAVMLDREGMRRESQEPLAEWEYWMHLNRRPPKIAPPWVTNRPEKQRPDPLLFTEIVWKSGESPTSELLTYPFCDATVHWGGTGWIIGVMDGEGKLVLTLGNDEGFTNHDVEIRLPILYFFDPKQHDLEWIKEREKHLWHGAEGKHRTIEDEQQYRNAGWYGAAMSRSKYNYDKDYLANPSFWTLIYLAWYFRYKTDFMEHEDEMFEWGSILIWEELRNKTPRWEGDEYGLV